MSPVAHFVVLAAVYLVSPGEKRCVTSLKTAARESEVYSSTNERSNRCYFHFFISFNFFVTSLQSLNLIREKITT